MIKSVTYVKGVHARAWKARPGIAASPEKTNKVRAL
jgi:hypothetical protein